MNKIKKFFTSAFVLCLWLMMLCFPGECMKEAFSALLLWAKNLICVMFPFFVLSDLLNQSGANKIFEFLLAPIFKLLPSLPPKGAGAYFVSLAAGSPAGIRAAGLCLIDSDLNAKKAMSALCSNPGLMFCLSTIGAGFFSNQAIGIRIYFSCILSCIAVCAAVSRFYLKKGAEYKKASSYYMPSYESVGGKLPGSRGSFSSAIAKGIEAVINVGGFIVFFSLIRVLIKRLCFVKVISDFLCVVSEMTYGSYYISALKLSEPFKACLCAALVSFGGACGVMQASVYLTIPLKSYIIIKLWESALSFIICALLVYI